MDTSELRIEPSLVAISVGNTRTAVGLFSLGRLERAARFLNGALDEILAWVADAWSEIDGRPEAAILIASVNQPVSKALRTRLRDSAAATVDDERIYRVGDDLPIPIGRQLDPEAIVGQDRLLNAAAAYDRVKQACVIIDAGTAVTVDFVDGEGTFHGGAIGPGARMQLSCMSEHTDALPEVEWKAPDDEPFGANTRQAMLQGVFYGIRGMARHLIERYAEAYQAYPMIIATGGDAHLLFDSDELIEHIVDDLTLWGIAAVARVALEQREEV